MNSLHRLALVWKVSLIRHTELQQQAAVRLQAEQFVVKELAAAAKSNKLKGFERIAAVHLEPEPFSAENGLMTPSFKLKRPQLQKHYQKLIDECVPSACHRYPYAIHACSCLSSARELF